MLTQVYLDEDVRQAAAIAMLAATAMAPQPDPAVAVRTAALADSNWLRCAAVAPGVAVPLSAHVAADHEEPSSRLAGSGSVVAAHLRPSKLAVSPPSREIAPTAADLPSVDSPRQSQQQLKGPAEHIPEEQPTAAAHTASAPDSNCLLPMTGASPVQATTRQEAQPIEEGNKGGVILIFPLTPMPPAEAALQAPAAAPAAVGLSVAGLHAVPQMTNVKRGQVFAASAPSAAAEDADMAFAGENPAPRPADVTDCAEVDRAAHEAEADSHVCWQAEPAAAETPGLAAESAQTPSAVHELHKSRRQQEGVDALYDHLAAVLATVPSLRDCVLTFAPLRSQTQEASAHKSSSTSGKLARQ